MLGQVKASMASSSHDEMRSVVNEIRVIDSHEHLMSEQDRVAQDIDILSTFFRQYSSSDLVSSGMSREDLQTVVNPRIPLDDRWKIFQQYWDNVRHTGYARVLDIAVRDLYGVDGIAEETYVKLSKKMKEANRPGVYKWILKDRAKIERCVLDPIDELGRAVRTVDVDRTFFVPVMQFDDFVMVNNIFDLKRLSNRLGIAIHSLPDLVKALERQFEIASGKIAGVKIALAYFRTIRFEKTGQAEAEKAFNAIFKLQPLDWRPDSIPGAVLTYGPSLEEARPLQDYMMHKVVQLAAKHDLPVQIHAGLLEGFGNILSNSNPLNLTNLFVEYSDVRFDIFHGGYPYTSESGTLAKNFQNVYVDMCWLHAISPSVARAALSEWLDTVPVNKIMAFGGDYIFAEGTYGHSVLARDNIARVLSDRVEDGSMKLEDAKAIARRMLRDNALELFRIDKVA
jgi:predicted TIM-barrel fold metal-dependent hydrolase